MSKVRKRWSLIAILMLSAIGMGKNVSAATPGKSQEERRKEYKRLMEKMMDVMAADELAEELAGVIHRSMDSERREKRRRELARGSDTGDEALLERIGRLVVQWVNTRLTPRTDDECDWSWGRWRCDPQCSCQYRYRFGDYAPGRSCRLRPAEEQGLPTCNPDAGNDISLLEKLGSFVGRVAERTWRFTVEHVVPQTDKDCKFSLAHSLEKKRVICTPAKSCTFQYKFGDLHPGRSCRVRQPGNPYSGSDEHDRDDETWSLFPKSDGGGRPKDVVDPPDGDRDDLL